MIFEWSLYAVLVFLAVYLISAIPLYFAVSFLGRGTSLFKAAFVNLLVGVLSIILNLVFSTYGGILSFIVMLFVYRESFKLKWFKAFLVWLLEIVFMFLFVLLLLLIFGVSLASFALF